MRVVRLDGSIGLWYPHQARAMQDKQSVEDIESISYDDSENKEEEEEQVQKDNGIIKKVKKIKKPQKNNQKKGKSQKKQKIKISIKKCAKKLIKLYEQNKINELKKFIINFKNINNLQKVIKRICKLQINVELVKLCCEIMDDYEYDISMMIKLRFLIKKEERLPILSLYLDLLIKNEYNDEGTLKWLIKESFRDLSYALKHNKAAFILMIDKYKMKNDIRFIQSFINYLQPDLWGSALEHLNTDGRLSMINGKLVDVFSFLKKIDNIVERIKYIIDNIKFEKIDFDVNRFDECCICLRKPIDVIIGSCGHFTCSTCFINIFKENKENIKCSTCRKKELLIDKMGYSFYPIDLTNDVIDIHRYNNVIIIEKDDGDAIVYDTS